MSRIADLESLDKTYDTGWSEGLAKGAETALDTVISMLERELYKNKSEDVYYEYALISIINKIKEIKND